MADRVVPGRTDDSACIRQAVSVNTRKIFDSCRDKDCVDDLRVYPTACSQSYIENALSLRAKNAELLYVNVKVAPVAFNRGYYTVDATYFYRITAETFPQGHLVSGLAVFDKRVMLFGSLGSVRTFSSDCTCPIGDIDDLPVAVVSSVDPVVLHCKLTDSDCMTPTELENRTIPEFIGEAFPEGLVMCDTKRRWYVTIGQFSIIRLERDTQLVIPAYDYSMPDKECPCVTEDDPCSLFGRIRFPMDEFFPPDCVNAEEDYRSLK